MIPIGSNLLVQRVEKIGVQLADLESDAGSGGFAGFRAPVLTGLVSHAPTMAEATDARLSKSRYLRNENRPGRMSGAA
jgi:hypothetical protein